LSDQQKKSPVGKSKGTNASSASAASSGKSPSKSPLKNPEKTTLPQETMNAAAADEGWSNLPDSLKPWTFSNEEAKNEKH
jgi:hypothetical protein